MNLLIHDLSPTVWAGIRSDYTGWAVVKKQAVYLHLLRQPGCPGKRACR